jgi:hypothetical protein
MKKITFVFMFLSSLSVFGQIDLDPDTVRYQQKTGGAIDTFDISNADLPSTFEGGRSMLSLNGLSTKSLYQDISTRKFQRFTKFDPLKFSAIPHLGFAYSFGGQGSQFVRLDYSQAFSEHFLFNLKYDRNSGLGYIQNSGYSENNLRAQLQRDAKRYSFQLKASFQSWDVAHSGGVVNSTSNYDVIDTLGLEFAAINKTDASSSVKLGSAFLKNYFNFSPDSLNHFGLTTHHHYTITNREYLELDNLSAIYSSIYIDSSETRDQFNLARIRNAGGAYFSNRNSQFYLDALIEHTYWNFQNLGVNRDTNEIGFTTNARIRIKDFVLTNEARLNLIGGFNEWSEEARLKYSKGKLKVTAGLVLMNFAPDPFQRSYFANNFSYMLSSIEKQTALRVGGSLNWNVKDSVFNFSVSGDFNSLSAAYVFDGDRWRNDSLNSFSLGSIKAKAHLALGNFNIIPTLVYSFDNNGYLPSFQAYSRIYFKGRLFEAKRLEVLFGVDASYTSQFNNRVYVPAMDSYNLFVTPGTNQTNSIFNLHAFASFGIEEFRFYVRYENIGYFWSDRRNEEQFGFPISSTRLRVGLTWDFFN